MIQTEQEVKNGLSKMKCQRGQPERHTEEKKTPHTHTPEWNEVWRVNIFHVECVNAGVCQLYVSIDGYMQVPIGFENLIVCRAVLEPKPNIQPGFVERHL